MVATLWRAADLVKMESDISNGFTAEVSAPRHPNKMGASQVEARPERRAGVQRKECR